MNRIQYLIRFGYIGHYFHGLQYQPTVPTVAGAVGDLIERAAGRRPSALQFGARTDKHVSALITYATCWFKEPFDTEQFETQLKRSTQLGILGICATRVPRHVHARGSSRGKHYRYVIEDAHEGDSSNPFVWQVKPVLDVDAMREAAQYLVGEHDFSSFRAKGCTANNPVKTISSIRLSPQRRLGSSGALQGMDASLRWHDKYRGQIHIDIYGDAFLRQMIRIIVGTLCEVGIGFRHPGDMQDILKAQHRRAAGPAAPAQGLTLMELYLSIVDS